MTALDAGPTTPTAPGLAIGPWLAEDPATTTFRVQREVFRSEEVFAREQERIWGSTWLYLAHRSEVPNQGDFVTRTLGGRDLVVVHDHDDEIRVFFNACPHRGTVLAREPAGNARFFRCFYHAWSFSTEGALVALPDEAAYPAGDEFRERMRLRQVPCVDAVGDFVFVAFDPGVPPLRTHLGPAADYIEMVSQHHAGGMAVLPGTQRYRVRGNWKLAVENAMDGYHFGPTHATFVSWLHETGFTTSDEGGKAVVLGHGHSVLVQSGHSGRVGLKWEPRFGETEQSRIEANREELFARLGPERASIVADTSRILYVFPNLLLFDIEALSIRQLEPLAPGHTEVRAWELAPAEEPAEARALRIKMLVAFVGPGGLATPDDIEAYEAIQRGVQTTRDPNGRTPDFNDISRGYAAEHAGLPYDARLQGVVSRSIDEAAIRSFWRSWAACLT